MTENQQPVADQVQMMTEDGPKWVFHPRAVNIVEPLPTRSELTMGVSDLRFISTKQMPNIWHRFWHKILLNWTWREIDAS